ncbi:CHAP domain-containing protein [Corynebacterium meridianum]|uniref:CHAP domain-containing protein n=1 Tax=Corynebacterium meridianum TaxID=2765363 RepID=A0A934I2L9_9CORY|nr:CHAP domain-containing protein [Corynebacterium meridianum]MBI8990130.1 CHAP domain-containing protein [Corynebacterium meridianum]
MRNTRQRRRMRMGASLLSAGTVLAAIAAPASAAIDTTCDKNSYDCVTVEGYGPYTDTWADKYYIGGKHNCTRYAAYVMAKRGLEDPGHSWGNAVEWWENAPGEKNNEPAVGAIAYFDAEWTTTYFGAESNLGHVGIVDKVNDDGSVEVSWDSWAPPKTAVQVYSGDQLPTGYIHIRDEEGDKAGDDEGEAGEGQVGGGETDGSDTADSGDTSDSAGGGDNQGGDTGGEGTDDQGGTPGDGIKVDVGDITNSSGNTFNSSENSIGGGDLLSSSSDKEGDSTMKPGAILAFAGALIAVLVGLLGAMPGFSAILGALAHR